MNRTAELGLSPTDDLGTPYHAASSHAGGQEMRESDGLNSIQPFRRESPSSSCIGVSLFPIDLTL